MLILIVLITAKLSNTLERRLRVKRVRQSDGWMGLEVATYWATTTDSERHTRTPEAQSRLISMSARGRLPTNNTFELIRKWKLVKEEEEKQQQKVKVRWTVPTLLPRLSLAGLKDP